MNFKILYNEKGTMLKRNLFLNKDSEIINILDIIFKDSVYAREQCNIKYALLLYPFKHEDKICKHENCNNKVSINKGSNKKNNYCSNKCASSSSKTIKKRKNTCIKQYGFDNPLKVKEFKDKSICTMLEKYNSKNAMQVKKFNDKMHLTMKNRYGHSHALQIKEFKDKIDYVENSNSFVINQNKQFIIDNFIKNDKFLIFKFTKYFNVSNSTAYLTLKYFDIVTSKIGVSEKEIYIRRQINHKLIINSKKIIQPYELDIYIEKLKVAIEYNGMYWHRHQENSDKFRHQKKSLMCKELGIQLFHIYEDLNESLVIDIVNSLNDEIVFDCSETDEIIIDLDYDNGLWLENDYDLVEILEPELIKNTKYPIYNSGYLKYKRKNK